MGLSQQEYWSGWPFPTPKDLPNPGIKLESSTSLALAVRFFTTVLPGKPIREGICQEMHKTNEQHFCDSDREQWAQRIIYDFSGNALSCGGSASWHKLGRHLSTSVVRECLHSRYQPEWLNLGKVKWRRFSPPRVEIKTNKVSNSVFIF